MRTIIAVVAALALVACKPQGGAVAVPSAQAAPAVPHVAAPVVHEYTKAEWTQAIKATYSENSAKTDGEGVTRFNACFKGKMDPDKKGKCDVFMFGVKDGFRDQTRFKPAGSSIEQIVKSNYLHSYVAMVGCDAPAVVVRPLFAGKEWLFMDQVAVMADGEVVLKHQFDHTAVHREQFGAGWVFEDAAWVLGDSELAALRKIADAHQVIIRLTGERYYATVDKREVKEVQSDLRDVLYAYQALKAAAGSHTPVSCKT